MRKNLIGLLLAVLLVIFSSGCGASETVIKKAGDEAETADAEASEEYVDEAITLHSPTDETLAVYVCGAVALPGVYYLEADCLKKDALEMAGGFADGAADWYVNLAEALTDGEKIYFPYETEFEDGSSPLKLQNEAGQSESGSSGAGETSTLININTAGREELMTLNGVGESRADAIIKYREENGAYKDISEICNVSGIKDGLYSKIKDYITVD